MEADNFYIDYSSRYALAAGIELFKHVFLTINKRGVHVYLILESTVQISEKTFVSFLGKNSILVQPKGIDSFLPGHLSLRQITNVSDGGKFQKAFFASF